MTTKQFLEEVALLIVRCTTKLNELGDAEVQEMALLNCPALEYDEEKLKVLSLRGLKVHYNKLCTLQGQLMPDGATE